MQAAQSLAGENVEANRDQRAGGGIEQFMQPRRANQSVANIAARRPNGVDLHVLAKPIIELAIAGGHFMLDARERQQRLAADERIHALDQPRQIALDDEILALVHERLDGCGNALGRAA